jgi:S-adenosylmethionine:tRNA ribosyltransferase-isomerase
LVVGDDYLDRCVEELPSMLSAGDVLVVNDAATLPGALHGTFGDQAIELRLCGPPEGRRVRAVLFGAGDWRMRTEDRPPPPTITVGALLTFADLSARVVEQEADTPRLLTLDFDRHDDALYAALYRLGRPVQYAYVERPLPLWSVQTAYAQRPWAAEAPSAGLSLTSSLLVALRRRGVILARLTHAAGLSSTGDAHLDAKFPLDERYDIPLSTVVAIAEARRAGHRVIAVGTTVTRALEAAAQDGLLAAGTGVASLRLSEASQLQVVDAILTGVHEPGGSHFTLLAAFTSRTRLNEAYERSTRAGYTEHEFGDVWLVWRQERPVSRSLTFHSLSPTASSRASGAG